MAVNGIPVVWYPASNPDFGVGRGGKQPIAIVHHRIVGSLGSADLTFAAGDHDPATVGSTARSVASHFGIGHRGGVLEIHQYVDLSDTAYCNGDWDATGNWDDWYGVGHVTIDGSSMTDINARTVSIEHEDQGGSSDPTKKGIVTEDIIKASIALDHLMLSGNPAAIRAAGIRMKSDTTAAALKKIVPGPRTLIDHHDVAGKLKPYCWRPWSADAVGFPRSRYIKELTAVVVAPPPPPPPPVVPVPDLTPYSQADMDAGILKAKQTQYDLDASSIVVGPSKLSNARP